MRRAGTVGTAPSRRFEAGVEAVKVEWLAQRVLARPTSFDGEPQPRLMARPIVLARPTSFDGSPNGSTPSAPPAAPARHRSLQPAKPAPRSEIRLRYRPRSDFRLRSLSEVGFPTSVFCPKNPSPRRRSVSDAVLAVSLTECFMPHVRCFKLNTAHTKAPVACRPQVYPTAEKTNRTPTSSIITPLHGINPEQREPEALNPNASKQGNQRKSGVRGLDMYVTQKKLHRTCFSQAG